MVCQRVLVRAVFSLAIVTLIMCITDIFLPKDHYFESNTIDSFDRRQLENISFNNRSIFRKTPNLGLDIADGVYGLRNFPYQLRREVTLNNTRRESLLTYNCSTGGNSHCLMKPIQILIRPTSACKTKKRNLLLLMIFSRPMNVEGRQRIRATWGKTFHGSRSNFVSRVFLLGISGEKDEAPWQEAKKFGDILLGEFRDTYVNLTLKTIMGYDWFSSDCNNVDFLMKTDDDMYVNTAALVTALQTKRNWQMKMIGYCMGYYPVRRDLSKKWAMPWDEYPDTLFPYFCSGTGYVIGGTAARKVAAILKWIPVFRVEDAYIGVALTRLEDKVTMTHMPRYFRWMYADNDRPLCPALTAGRVYTVHSVSLKKMEVFNERCQYSPDALSYKRSDDLGHDTFDYYWLLSGYAICASAWATIVQLIACHRVIMQRQIQYLDKWLVIKRTLWTHLSEILISTQNRIPFV